MIRNVRSLSIFMSLLYIVSASGGEQKGRAKMTVFCYMVGDVSQLDALRFNCSQMALTDMPRDMRLFFYAVRTRNDQPIDYFDGTVKNREIQHVQKPARNVGHGGLFLQGLRRAIRENSEHVCVVMLHRTAEELQYGAKSFIVSPAITEALKKYKEEAKKPLDLLVLDAGLTATEQMVRVFNPYARFMLASQSPQVLGGFPYHLMIKSFKDGNRDPVQFGCSWVRSHKDYYELLTGEYSAVLFDLHAIAPLSNVLQSMSTFFAQALKQARLAHYPPPARNYFDLRSACESLLNARKHKNTPQDQTFKDGLAQVIAFIRKGTLCRVQGRAQGHGLSIFVPGSAQPVKRKKV